MKVLKIEINEKTYTTGKITCFLSKEALKIQKEALSLAEKGIDIQKAGQEVDLKDVDSLLSKLLEVKERKTWLICEVFGNKFTADELEKSFSDEEIEAQINDIITGVSEVVQKN